MKKFSPKADLFQAEKIEMGHFNLKLKVLIFGISFLFFILTSQNALAVTNISSTDKWAWNDVVGWINFYSPDFVGIPDVRVTDSKIEGYAVFQGSPGNYLSLNCATGPPGSNCAFNYFVSNNGSGSLAGWSWSDAYGWVSFCGNAAGGSTWNGSTWVCPAVPTYQAMISPSGVNGGDFSGWAWNDIIGWISFNCNSLSPVDCAPAYKVNTSWRNGPVVTGSLVSSTYDTGHPDGVSFNSITWKGILGIGQNAVRFQLGSSNCPNGATNNPLCTISLWSDPSSYKGPDGSSSSYYVTTAPDAPVQIVTAQHNNKRYYRYKIYLDFQEVIVGATKPVVEDVIINWSP